MSRIESPTIAAKRALSTRSFSSRTGVAMTM